MENTEVVAYSQSSWCAEYYSLLWFNWNI